MTTCHAIGCTKRINSKMLMCRRHWFMVPKPLREAIWASYRTEPGSDTHRANCLEARRVVAEKEKK